MTELQLKVLEYRKKHPNASQRDMAAILGISRTTVQTALRLIEHQSKEHVEIDLGEQQGMINSTSNKICTVEDVLAYAKIDPDLWEVDRVISNHWDTTMKIGDDKHKTVTNYQIKVYLKRKITPAVERALATVNKIKSVSIKPKKLSGNNVAFIGLYDTHFGKLGWKEEVDENCDLKTTKKFYLNAIYDTVERLKAFRVSKIIYPIGQDFLHINNANNTTMNDTRLDVDGRLAKVYSTAFETAVLGIEHCLKHVPCEVIYLTGNHDRDTSWYLSHAIQQRFHKCPHLTVDLKPIIRKYRLFGTCLIGMAHAESKRERSRLHNLMPTEQKDVWGKVTCCEWLTGHYHARGEERITTVSTDIMQTIRTLPSLSGRDKWHFDNAYISPRACETYVYSPNYGYVGHISTNPRRS